MTPKRAARARTAGRPAPTLSRGVQHSVGDGKYIVTLRRRWLCRHAQSSLSFAARKGLYDARGPEGSLADLLHALQSWMPAEATLAAFTATRSDLGDALSDYRLQPALHVCYASAGNATPSS